MFDAWKDLMRLKTDPTLLSVSIPWDSTHVAERVAGQLGGVYYSNGLRYLLAALVVLPFVGRDNISSLGGRVVIQISGCG